MEESSEAKSFSSDQESVPKVWQCTHCQATAPGMKPGYVPKFCFECGAAQIKCINPKCNELLFSDKAEFCHECHTPQRVPQQPQRTSGRGGTKEPDPGKGNANIGDNHNSKDDKPDERLSSDNTKPTAPPDSHGNSSVTTPAAAAAVQQSPAGDSASDPGPQQQAGKGGDKNWELDEDKTPPKLKADQNETVTIQTKSQHKSLTLDSEESSEEEEYHTPSPGKDEEEVKSKGATGDRQSNNSTKDVSQIDKPLTRLSLRERCKHERDESVDDSDDSNPTKKAALGEKKPPLSPSASDSATLDSEEEKDNGKRKDLAVKGDQQQEKNKSEVTKHPLQEDTAMEVPRTLH
jgi:hypothetical protein